MRAGDLEGKEISGVTENSGKATQKLTEGLLKFMLGSISF